MPEQVSTVFVVLAECFDYYCDGDHLLGIFTNREQADNVVRDRDRLFWYDAEVEEITVGVPLDANRDPILVKSTP